MTSGAVMAFLPLVTAPASLAGLWLLFEWAEALPIPPLLNGVITAALVVGGVVLVLVGWGRVGGLHAQRALRQWVRGGPDRSGVSLVARLRFLRQQPAASSSFLGGWLYLGLAVLWLGLAVPELLDGERKAALYVGVAVVWGVGGTVRLIFTRRWGSRVQHLVAQTETSLDESDDATTPEQFR